MNDIELLTSPAGRELLSTLDAYDPSQSLTLTTQLRNAGYEPDVVAAALTQSRLRAKAEAKFGPFAPSMLFTTDGLEQATRLPVAVHHAQRFVQAGAHRVLDLGCGIGGDSMAFAGLGLRTVSVEIDPTTAQAAAFNLGSFPEATVLQTDGRTLDLSSVGADALWLDPARRKNGRRINNPEEWEPALSVALNLARQFPAAGIKIAPGIDYAVLPRDAHVQWISDGGELLEAVIWLGQAATRPGRSALILREGSAHRYSAAVDTPDVPATIVAPRPLGRYVYEPDPAIIRSGALASVCDQFDLAPVSDMIAYLTGDDEINSPLLDRFTVDEALPMDTKTLAKILNARGISAVEIKKRGAQIDPAELRKKLKLSAKKGGSITVLATPLLGTHSFVLAHREK